MPINFIVFSITSYRKLKLVPNRFKKRNWKKPGLKLKSTYLSLSVCVFHFSGLVTNKLAACVNIIPGVKSLYLWKGKLEEDAELILVSTPDL